jgi:Ser/Thr protein kinase RdoA (MazF antagonist)
VLSRWHAMMKLSEIYQVSLTVDDRRCSPLADCLGELWNLEPGILNFLRSSASHVFVAGGSMFPHGARYLRAIPADARSSTQVKAMAELVGSLHRGGAPVAYMLPSRDGRVIETVSTPWGSYHAMLVEGAAGERVDVAALTAVQARAWGAALATIHSCVREQPGLPLAFDRLRGAGPVFADDPPLAAAIAVLAGRVSALPADADNFGVVHGDFELDNIAWADNRPTVFDFDEAQQSWFVDDITQATRDIRHSSADAPAASAGLLGHFLTGYRTVRPIDDHLLGVSVNDYLDRQRRIVMALDSGHDMGPGCR